MKASTKAPSMVIGCAVFVCLLCVAGCSGTPSVTKAAYVPAHVIRNFSEMREHEIVSWAWIRRGFMLDACSTVTVKPVIDACIVKDAATAAAVEEGLRSLLDGRGGSPGGPAVSVRAAVVDARQKPGWFKKWFMDFDELPYVELELLIAEQDTGLPMAKVVHFRRNKESLTTAVTDLLGDIDTFFSTAL